MTLEIMSAEAIKNILKESETELKSSISEKMLKEVANSISYKIPHEANEIVQEFMKERIKPVLMEYLLNNEGVILEALRSACSEIAVDLAKTLRDKACENLSKSWEVDKIVKGLFG